MIKAVKGIDSTKALIGNVIGRVRSQKLKMNHIDYSITMTHSNGINNITTCEEAGKLRNVSLIRVNTKNLFVKNIMAAVWNESGAIRLEQKSVFTKTETAMGRVKEFLKALQPENRVKPEDTHLQLGAKGTGGQIEEINSDEKYWTYKISTKIEGSNSRHSWEGAKPYLSEDEFLK